MSAPLQACRPHPTAAQGIGDQDQKPQRNGAGDVGSIDHHFPKRNTVIGERPVPANTSCPARSNARSKVAVPERQKQVARASAGNNCRPLVAKI